MRYHVPQISLPSCFLLKRNYTCQVISCLMFNKRKADQWLLGAAGLLPGARRMKLTYHSLFLKLLDTWYLLRGKSFIPQRCLLKSSYRKGIQQFITSICSTSIWHNAISASLQGLKSEIGKAAFLPSVYLFAEALFMPQNTNHIICSSYNLFNALHSRGHLC